MKSNFENTKFERRIKARRSGVKWLLAGGILAACFCAEAQNTRPVLGNISFNSPVFANGTVSLAGTITDPYNNSFKLGVDWGDWSGMQVTDLPAGATNFSVTHQYAPLHANIDSKSFPLVVTLTDSGEANVNGGFVDAAYSDIVDRAADSAGKNFFLTLLNGGQPRSAVADSLLNSTEGRTARVTEWFWRYLHRAPDSGALNNFVSQIAAGATDESIMAQFLSSAEYFALHGSQNSGFLDGLYEDVLNRAADAGSKNVYLNALNSSQLSRSQAATSFLTSTEARTLQVQNVCQKYLWRAADSALLNFYVNALVNSSVTTVQMISAFVSSAEYFANRTGGTTRYPASTVPTFIIVNATMPSLSIGNPSTLLTNSGSVTYTVTYSNQTSITLAAGNIALNHTGSANGTVAVSGSTGNTRTATISNLTGDGTLSISIAAGTASDAAGHTAPAAGPSTAFTVDTTAPTLSISSPSAATTLAGPVTYTVTYIGADAIAFTSNDITLNHTGTANGIVVVSGGGNIRTVTISSITGEGTLGISIGPGTATDLAGNSASGTGPSSTFAVVPPVSIICSTNIIVTASGPNGAMVFYAITASGGCTTPTATANPPSGNTFPIGTTTVAASASDRCGNYAYCSFTVTVNPPRTVPEYFSAANLMPPANSVYLSPGPAYALYANGIVIRDVRYRGFTQNSPLPSNGPSQSTSFGAAVELELSTDGGTTFHSASALANFTVLTTKGPDQGGKSFFDTEMLQLDIAGGTLPAGILVRESPTLASLGQHTLRAVAGVYMLSSFFDIFTEVSVDGGQNWAPAQAAARVELHADPLAVTPVGEPTALMPPPNGAYAASTPVAYAAGVVIRQLRHSLFSSSQLPPGAGVTQTQNFDSQWELFLSTDGGNTFQYGRVSASAQVQLTGSGSGNGRLFDTEMTSLTLTLPGGVMLRESPTEPSRGEVQIDPQPDGTYRISSFFDIFTELSLDGGQTWFPASTGPVRMTLQAPAPEQVMPTPNLPPTNSSYASPGLFSIYANGVIISNVTHRAFSQSPPPPPPGQTQTASFDSTVDLLISTDGGATFRAASAPAPVAVQVNGRGDLDTSSTRFFDTEMLALNVSGGNLPAGLLIRESPTRASLGRTSVRQNAVDGSYRVSSFFDVFTELSLDGGQTWSPSTAPPGRLTLSASPAILITCPSNLTVTASGSAGATVSYSVTASGGCSAPTVTLDPPSGRIFPIGMTTVTALARDTCGNSSTCTFQVTVVRPGRFFPTNLLLPPTGQYLSPPGWAAHYPNGVIVSNVFQRRFTLSSPPPPPGGTSTLNFGSEIVFSLSADGGQTFRPVAASANCIVRVDGSSGTPGEYPMEILALDLSGGSLPPGVLLRESPTLASLGETQIQPAPGGYMISSFFDIFTEISLDGGQTWAPADTAWPMELHLDPASSPTSLTNFRVVGGQPMFTLMTQLGLRYFVEHKKNLNDATWSTLSSTSGTGQELTVADATSIAVPRGFYRVRVEEDISP